MSVFSDKAVATIELSCSLLKSLTQSVEGRVLDAVPCHSDEARLAASVVVLDNCSLLDLFAPAKLAQPTRLRLIIVIRLKLNVVGILLLIFLVLHPANKIKLRQ